MESPTRRGNPRPVRGGFERTGVSSDASLSRPSLCSLTLTPCRCHSSSSCVRARPCQKAHARGGLPAAPTAPSAPNSLTSRSGGRYPVPAILSCTIPVAASSWPVKCSAEMQNAALAVSCPRRRQTQAAQTTDAQCYAVPPLCPDLS